MKRLKVQLLCVTALFITALPLIVSADGGMDGGGGHRMGVDFFYHWLLEKKFDPSQDLAFSKLIEPKLKQIESWVPVFAGDLREILENREWYTALPKEIIPAYKAGILFNAEEVAYQTKEEVYFDGKWLSVADSENRATGYLHELVQGVRIMQGTEKIRPENVWRLTIRLLSNKYKNAKELKNALESMGFSGYQTQSEIDQGVQQTQEVREIAYAYTERLKAICATHNVSTDYGSYGKGTEEMQIVVRELLNRVGYYTPEELIQAGQPNLSLQYSDAFQRELMSLFSFLTIHELNDFKRVALTFNLDKFGYRAGAEARIGVCNRLEVKIHAN